MTRRRKGVGWSGVRVRFFIISFKKKYCTFPCNIRRRKGFGKLNKNCTVNRHRIYVDRGLENKILDLKI
jgi:hypothetical protein